MAETSIQWTDKVWNPTQGCSLASPGCHGCYAMKFAHRFSGEGQRYEGLTRLRPHKNGPVWTGKVRLDVSKLDLPTRWKKPARIFVNSMSDLFHEELTNEEIAAVFGVMAACPQHTFQVLTKRAERMADWFRWVASQESVDPTSVCEIAAANLGAEVDQLAPSWPLRNVWLGVSVEDQRRADERIPRLLDTPAAVRFLSCEPLLGPLNLHRVRPAPLALDALRGGWGVPSNNAGPVPNQPRISWVVVGGESGQKARVFDLAWARSLRDQCEAAGVPYFFKQAGANVVDSCHVDILHPNGSVSAVRPDGHPDHEAAVARGMVTRPHRRKLSDRAGGDPVEWPESLRIRQFPEAR